MLKTVNTIYIHNILLKVKTNVHIHKNANTNTNKNPFAFAYISMEWILISFLLPYMNINMDLT